MISFDIHRRSLLAAAALAAFAGMAGAAFADTEIVYASNLDPANNKDPRVAAQQKILEAFEKANPGVKVRVLVDPTQASYLRALKSKSASPDVVKVIGFGVPEYAATGSLEPLDDLVASEKIDENDWLVPLSKAKIDGHLYGLPLDYRIPIFIYRKSLLEVAGLQPPKTWDEACKISQALSKDGKIGYAVGVGAGGGLGGAQAFGELMFSSMATEGASDYFDATGTQFLVSEEKFVRAAQTIKDFYTNCNVPTAALQFGYNEIHDGLRAGTVASATFGLYRFGAIVTAGAGDDLAWAPGPAYEPNGKQAVYGYVVALNKNSAHKDEAKKLIAFLGSPEAQAIALEGGEVVARASVYKGGPYFETDAGKRQAAWSELIKERGFLPSYPLSLTAYNLALGEALQRMVLRDATPKEAYEEVKSRYQRAMDQAQ